MEICLHPLGSVIKNKIQKSILWNKFKQWHKVLRCSSSLSDSRELSGYPSPTHTVPLAPGLMYHLWITVISVWWMFSEWRGPHVPQTGASVAGCSSEEMGPLLLEVYYTSIPLLSWAHILNTTFQCIHPAFFPAICVCMYMHACLLTRVSHRSPLRGRLPSRGDAWVPAVNFTAFIWPDEWLAALSVPLPAISSASLEPRTAWSAGRSLQHTLALLLPHTP